MNENQKSKNVVPLSHQKRNRNTQNLFSMKKLIFFLAMMMPIGIVMAQDDNTEKLWYDTPAKIWLEALPIGNSHLGAMVYGGIQADEIQLNEETFWSGGPHNNNSKTSLNYLDKVRELIFSGKESEAETLINNQFVKLALMVCVI